MKRSLFLIGFLMACFSTFGASDGSVRIQSGGSTTNTKSSSITVSAMTNLLAGSVTASNLTANKIIIGTTGGQLISATNTGNGSVVLDTSPTIVTPTIASLANATHTHQNAAGGGTLDAAAIAAGTLAKARGGTAADNSSVTFPSSGTVTTDTGTSTFQNKSYDASDTGNTLKLKGYIQLIHPQVFDGAGVVPQTNDYTATSFMHGLFSGTAATNANFVEYRFVVPEDLDTAVDLKVSRWKVRLNAGDTSASTYNIGMADVADSASSAGSFSNWVQMPVASDASGAANDIETASAITLTSWKSSLTPGHLMVIRVNRDGAGDTSNIAHYDAGLVIEYGITQ